MRQGASRASRSTSRSTVIFAIRRQVVSLPPVIVIIPRGGLVQLGLARDVDGLLRVAGGDQRAHAGERAGQVARARASVPKNALIAVEQVVDVLAGGLDVLERALVVVVGGADQRVPEPRQREDRAPAAGRDDRPADERQVLVAQRDVRAAARPDARQLGLVVQLAAGAARRPTRRSR